MINTSSTRFLRDQHPDGVAGEGLAFLHTANYSSLSWRDWSDKQPFQFRRNRGVNQMG
jgi:hypothetical protein